MGALVSGAMRPLPVSRCFARRQRLGTPSGLEMFKQEQLGTLAVLLEQQVSSEAIAPRMEPKDSGQIMLEIAPVSSLLAVLFS